MKRCATKIFNTLFFSSQKLSGNFKFGKNGSGSRRLAVDYHRLPTTVALFDEKK